MAMWSFFQRENFFLFELFILIRCTATSTTTIAVSMLIQDKICTNLYHQNSSYCYNINTVMFDAKDQNVKNQILAQSAEFNNYKNLLECIPMLIWSLFVGSFLDKFPRGTRLLLIVGIFADLFVITFYYVNEHFFLWSPYYLLASGLTAWFTGGMTSFLTVSYRYIAVNTTEQFRAIKFLLFQFAIVIGLSLGNVIGGQLLRNVMIKDVKDNVSLFGNSAPLRTYEYNFAMNFALDLISFALVFTLRNINKETVEVLERKPTNECNHLDENQQHQQQQDINHNTIIGPNNSQVSQDHLITNTNDSTYLINDDDDNDLVDGNNVEQITEINENDEDTKCHFLKVLFDLDNIRQTVNCFFKHRPGHVRLQIHLLYIILFTQVVIIFGLDCVLLQFCEKVFHWNTEQYSNFGALNKLLGSSMMTVASYFLIKRWQLSDNTLIMIALLSCFVSQLVVGIILTPLAYFISLPIGALSGFAIISTRNKLSKIVGKDEVGKIFSLASSFESILPLFGSVVYSNIFALTISNFPGAIYLFSAFIAVCSMVVMTIDEFACN